MSLHPNGEPMQFQPQHVIEALRQENAELREHNLALRAALLQTRAESQEEVAGLRSQLIAREARDAAADPES